MKQPIKLLLLFTLLIADISSHAAANDRIPLWGSSYYGMPLKELLHSYPNAQTKLEIPSIVLLKPNEQALAKLEHLEINHQSFNVWFLSSDDKLNRVILTLLPKSKESEASVVSEYINPLYTQYAILLTAKYGNPVRKSWQDYAPLNIRLWNTQWISGVTNIELTIDKSLLSIIYSADYTEDLRNL